MQNTREIWTEQKSRILEVKRLKIWTEEQNEISNFRSILILFRACSLSVFLSRPRLFKSRLKLIHECLGQNYGT